MQGALEFLLFDVALIGMPLLYIKFFERKKISIVGFAKEFGLEKGNLRQDVILSGKISVCLIIFSIITSLCLVTIGMGDFGPVQETIVNVSGLNIAIIAYIFTVRVFVEELFFRAFLAPRAGVVISSLLFGAMHLTYGSISEAIGAAVLGGILGIAFMEKRRLVPNFIAHAIYNFAVFTFVLVPQ